MYITQFRCSLLFYHYKQYILIFLLQLSLYIFFKLNYTFFLEWFRVRSCTHLFRATILRRRINQIMRSLSFSFDELDSYCTGWNSCAACYCSRDWHNASNVCKFYSWYTWVRVITARCQRVRFYWLQILTASYSMYTLSIQT